MLRVAAALVGLLGLVACSAGSQVPGPGPGSGGGSGASSGKDGTTVAGERITARDVPLAAGTCWTADRIGSDPQRVLDLAKRYRFDYHVGAARLADRPTLDRRQGCGSAHGLEVFRLVRLRDLEPRITGYATLVTNAALLARIEERMAAACMTAPLARAAAQTGLPGAIMRPALPAGAGIGWAPPSPDQWDKGQRAFACTYVPAAPTPLRYADVFTRRVPLSQRVCIDNRSLVWVDCARKHDREVIAVLEAKRAVAAKKLPGHRAVKRGPSGPYVDLPQPLWQRLDAACTTYLRAISTVTRLTGVAEADPKLWPAPGGSYPIDCEADVPLGQSPVLRTGSVYNRP